jgi:hypothetical protein
MEERSGAHRVMQRRLGDPDEVLPPETANESQETLDPTPAPPSEPGPPVPAISREPSDIELRKRQRAWRIERARFESARDRRRSTIEPSK